MSHEPEKPELPSDDEIEARFNKIREGLSSDLDDIDLKLEKILANTNVDDEKVAEEEHEQFDQRIRDLEHKVKTAQNGANQATSSSGSLSGSLDQKSSLSTGLGLSLAYTIIGAPLLGYAVGLGINKLTGTQGWQIWLTLIGSVIGIGWTMMVVNRNNDRL